MSQKPDNFYINNSFDILETVQSQYGASPIMQALIRGFNDLENVDPAIKLLLQKMIDPDTAEGVGLDVWGRIVAFERFLVPVTSQKFIGFKPPAGMTNNNLDSLNNAVFYNNRGGNIRLADSAYRTYIFIKAMLNISSSSLGDINRMIKNLLPNSNIKIIRNYAMQLRILVIGKLDPSDYRALISLPWIPTGVGLNLYNIETPTLGFNGQNLQTFNNGTFATNDPIYS